MAVTLTNDAANARVRVQAAGLPALTLGGTVAVQASTDNAVWRTVRGASALTPAGGAIDVYDYEYAPGVSTTYRVISNLTAWDAFGRVSAGSWGTADSGQAWSLADAALSATGTAGRVTLTVGGSRSVPLNAVTIADADIRVDVAITALQTGTESVVALILARRDNVGDKDYRAALSWQPSASSTGAVSLALQRRMPGVTSVLMNLPTWEVYNATETFRIRLQLKGSIIRLKAWRTTVAEPVAWNAAVIDTAIPSGGLNLAVSRNAGVTTPSSVVDFDNLTVDNATPLSLQSASITPTALTKTWLKSTEHPWLNMAIQQGLPLGPVRNPRGTAHDVLNSPLPVAVLEQAGSRTWPLRIRATTELQDTLLDWMLASGDVLYLHGPDDKSLPNRGRGVYLRFDQTGQSGQLRPRGDVHHLLLQLREVAAPGPDIAYAATLWDPLIASAGSVGNLVNAYPSWPALLARALI
jgi:hypothetical protein